MAGTLRGGRGGDPEARDSNDIRPDHIESISDLVLEETEPHSDQARW